MGRPVMIDRAELGKTGLRVSRVGFGGIPITRLTDAGAAALVREAIDAGVSFLDTAHTYPESEPRIGMAVSGVDRDAVVLASKDASADGPMFARHVEESLRRLGTDYLDLMQFHNVGDRAKWEAIRAPGGAYEAALRLKEQGKVRHLGVTSHNIALAGDMIESGLFETLQVPLNFVADEAEALLPRCRELGVGFIAMKPFAGGAIEDGLLAMRHLQQFDGVVPIPGIETRDELHQVVELYSAPRGPTGGERARMAQLKREIGKVFCRACGYCQPCPQGIAIPMILRAESFARRMPADRTRRAFDRHMPKIDACTGCGQCVERCPYDLDIPAMLPAKRAWYHQWLGTLEA